MTDLEIFGLGCLGGALPDVLRLIKARDTGAPAYLKTVFFWCMWVLLILLGGGAAYVSGPHDWKEAVTLGFSAPEVISRLVGGGHPVDRGADATQGGLWARVQSWWSI